MFRSICIVVLNAVLLFISPLAHAEPINSAVDSTVHKWQSKAEKEAEIAAAEAEADAKKEQYARVIVLRWQGTTTDQDDINLQRNVRSAIDKSDALFLPAIDLFQDGREIKGTTLAPEMQPSKVTDEDIDAVLAMVKQAKKVSFDDVDSNEWQSLGLKYRKVAERIWFVDRPELREPLFLLYAQIGRAGDNLSDSTAPFFEYLGGRNVNYYHYLAAVMAYHEPELLQKLDDEDVQGAINYYVGLLQRGVFPSMKVDFQMEDKFDAEKFGKQYEVLINGLPVELDENGEIDIFLGRADIYMKRKDQGVGLSDRFEAIKTEDKAYRILEIARKRMEIEFVRQLFLYENDCKPEVDSDILTYLAIYAKMHPEVNKQIYIAVPKAGNPNKVWVWRFDPATTTLNLVESGNEEFPVHFIASMGTGALYNGATFSYTAPTPDQIANGGSPLDGVNADMISANVPFAFDLRAHYTRFMLQLGMEFGMNLNGDGWTEYYQTPGYDAPNVVTVQVNEDCIKYVTPKNDGDPRRTGSAGECVIQQELYNTAQFSRNRYLGAAYLFGRDASFGYGLRSGVRVGWLNMPHSLLTTAHLGYTQQLELFEVGKRIHPVVDADLRVGTAISRNRSLAYDLGQIRQTEPLFGFTVTAGTTF